LHDAAAAAAGANVSVFGGGQAEGSRAIVRVLPGPARLSGELPRPLSDAAAVTVGGAFYVVGGWDGVTLEKNIYRDLPGRSPTVAGHLATGIRYPAVGSLSGKVLVAGGTTADGSATSSIQSFDPASGRTRQVAQLPYRVTDAAGAVLNGRLYVIGGLRDGSPTRTILAWAPGERRASPAGRLPRALSDLSAVATSNAIAVAGGRAATGPVAEVLLLRPGSSN
jgi:N-acetylneuraminic acid mutarotase